MDQGTALQKLMEAAALVGMVEELANPSTLERLSATSISGLRITLRSIRESIISSHAALSSDSPRSFGSPNLSDEIRKEVSSSVKGELSSVSRAMLAERRRDLRSALEMAMDGQVRSDEEPKGDPV